MYVVSIRIRIISGTQIKSEHKNNRNREGSKWVKQYVVFVINGDEFGLEIEKVSIIERVLEVFKIPNTPDYIEGLANLEARCIPY